MSIKTYADFIAEQQQKLRGAGLIDEADQADQGDIHIHLPAPDPNLDGPFERNSFKRSVGHIERIAKMYGLKHTVNQNANLDGYDTHQHTLHGVGNHPKRKEIMGELARRELYYDRDSV